MIKLSHLIRRRLWFAVFEWRIFCLALVPCLYGVGAVQLPSPVLKPCDPVKRAAIGLIVCVCVCVYAVKTDHRIQNKKIIKSSRCVLTNHLRICLGQIEDKQHHCHHLHLLNHQKE
ncbi:uncharacterized protein FA14DRAFT_30939 [Meira miltonrushii]|uniref:Uncharacterized protein n=1 Tax=Meira miltonrushii TaxID=1280837 RepID=A0A316VES2_9BASI|nr:uncharacterized protein FA14DRAFT_30939 [Meira miltonrushii]PWN34491.1 hypothetical protein FA14DRAFT_30939 [Meira miltonrushii]